MDRPRGYYAQWNKPHREGQIPYDFTYLWSIKTKQNKKQNSVRFIDTEKWLVVTKLGGGGLLNHCDVHLIIKKIEK